MVYGEIYFAVIIVNIFYNFEYCTVVPYIWQFNKSCKTIAKYETYVFGKLAHPPYYPIKVYDIPLKKYVI